MEPIIFENNGKEIKATNFWNHEYNRNGYFFVSINAGAMRLLVPDSRTALIPEMETGSQIIVSRGPDIKTKRPDAFEILFDDFTDEPFSIQLSPEQWTLLPNKEWGSAEFVFSVWSRKGKAFEHPAYYRVVDKIPCLKPYTKG